MAPAIELTADGSTCLPSFVFATAYLVNGSSKIGFQADYSPVVGISRADRTLTPAAPDVMMLALSVRGREVIILEHGRNE
jgi:hypothetical protein